MENQRIKEIRELCERATPGPWETDRPDGTYVVSGTGFNVAMTRKRDDATFIAHSRSDIPFLISELDRVTKERDAAVLDAREAGCGVCKHYKCDAHGRTIPSEPCQRCDAVDWDSWEWRGIEPKGDC